MLNDANDSLSATEAQVNVVGERVPLVSLPSEFPSTESETVRKNPWWRKLAAEFLGTMVFVFIGVASNSDTNASEFGGKPAQHLVVAFAHGTGLMLMVFVFGFISGGHFNPAVTFAVFLGRKIDSVLMLGYWGAQLLGAVTGAGFVRALNDKALTSYGNLLSTFDLAPDVSLGQGFFAETLLTFFLTTVVFGVAVAPPKNDNGESPNNGAYYGFAIGFSLFASILAGGSLTGACLNPARHFGPSLVEGRWLTNSWVYYLGPFFGASIASFVSQFVTSSESFTSAKAR